MKASELGLASIIYCLNNSGGADEFTPQALSMIGDHIEIKTENYGNLRVKKDFHFHEVKEKNLTFYFDEKSWLKALLTIQEKVVRNIEAELLQANNRLEKIKQNLNKIENGI